MRRCPGRLVRDGDRAQCDLHRHRSVRPGRRHRGRKRLPRGVLRDDAEDVRHRSEPPCVPSVLRVQPAGGLRRPRAPPPRHRGDDAPRHLRMASRSNGAPDVRPVVPRARQRLGSDLVVDSRSRRGDRRRDSVLPRRPVLERKGRSGRLPDPRGRLQRSSTPASTVTSSARTPRCRRWSCPSTATSWPTRHAKVRSSPGPPGTSWLPGRPTRSKYGSSAAMPALSTSASSSTRPTDEHSVTATSPRPSGSDPRVGSGALPDVLRGGGPAGLMA